jgi:NAD(P)-dependent dehydrogenase (short-subunit alcohol dehydrogenase family)
VLSWPGMVDILVNSAGIMGINELTLTPDGIEIHFATNHIGHLLFTNLIMPKLIKAAESKPKASARIVNISSGSPIMSNMR